MPDDHQHDHHDCGHGHGHAHAPVRASGLRGLFNAATGALRHPAGVVLTAALLGTTALYTPLLGTAIGAGAVLLGALWLLKQSADMALNNIEALGQRSKLSPLMLGLGLGALTSVPELFVAFQSMAHNARSIGIGNVVGSNVAHVFLILGATAAISGIARGKGLGWKYNTLAMAAATGAFGAQLALGRLTPVGGMAMFGMAAAYLAGNYLVARRDAKTLGKNVTDLLHNHNHDDGHEHHEHTHEHAAETPSKKPLSGLLGPGLLSAAGVGGLVLASELVVKGATGITAIDPASMGTLAVGLGTALPELVMNIKAARRGNTDLAVGNVLGCNIFNVLLVGGAMAMGNMVVPDAFRATSSLGAFNLAALGASAGLMTTMLLAGKGGMKKWQGYASLGLYAAYMAGALALGHKPASPLPPPVSTPITVPAPATPPMPRALS